MQSRISKNLCGVTLPLGRPQMAVRVPLSAIFYTSFSILVNKFLFFNSKKNNVFFCQNLVTSDKWALLLSKIIIIPENFSEHHEKNSHF